MTCYCSYSGEDLGNGIWSHIVKYAPPPEINEIKYIIGANIIEENQDLWRETGALKSILLEIDSSFNSSSSRKAKGGKSSIAKAKNFSELYYTEECFSQVNSLKGGSTILGAKNITLDYVVERVESIRSAVEDEKSMLETLIVQLNKEMDKQSESMLVMNEPEQVLSSSFSFMDLSAPTNAANLSIVCSLCNKKLSNKVDPTKIKSTFSDLNSTRVGKLPLSYNSSDRFVCTMCLEKKFVQDNKLGRNFGQVDDHFIQDFTKKTLLGSKSEVMLYSSSSDRSDNYIDTAKRARTYAEQRHTGNNNANQSPSSITETMDSESSPVPSVSRLSSSSLSLCKVGSKFKSRLIAARDELHFLDDF